MSFTDRHIRRDMIDSTEYRSECIHMPDLKGETIGRYLVLDILGSGGMGEVWRARDTSLDREVALKVLPDDFATDPDRLDRFRREAKAVAALSHPNILEIYDFGTEGSTVYAVTELLEGQTLREVIRSGSLTDSKARDYAALIANGLAAAHERGILHRDLKPENVFITTDGRIKILDFGLAKFIEQPTTPEDALETATQALLTQAGTVLGTIGYLAPEQLRGEPADNRSDIFALGCVLYEMLTGNRAFEGSNAHVISAAILQQDPRPIPDIGADLDRMVRRCLEKQPSDRFQSARDLAFALAPAAGGTAAGSSHGVGSRLRFGHVLAVIFAIAMGVLVVLPPEGLWQRLAGQTEATSIRSIAVLPLANHSGDPGQEYFADGMTDALITRLAQIGSLDIISRTSVMLYKNSDKPLPQIARELGVDAVVEGSVTRGEDDVRITVQLIHGASDHHIWAEEYQRPLREILLLQGEVAHAVAREINVALTPEEAQRLVKADRVDPEAHEAYLIGMHHFMLFTGAGIIKGKKYLERAIEVDPGYAEAYAVLAAIHLNSTYFLSLPPAEVVPRARELLVKALELDPDNAPAILSQAWIQMTYDWDWAASEQSHLRVLQLAPSLNPGHINYAYLLACVGRFDEAIAHARRAEQLDPLSLVASQQVGLMLYLARRYEDSIAQLEATIKLNPHFWFAHQRLAQTLLATSEYERGIEIMRRGIELAGPTTARPGKHLLAVLYAQSGRRQDALAILEETQTLERTTYIPPTDIAQIQGALGNLDEAFFWLDRAIEVRDADLFMLKVAPVWDPIRGDPRFNELVKRLDYPVD